MGGDVENVTKPLGPKKKKQQMFQFSLMSLFSDTVENPCQEVIVPRYRKGPSTCFDNNATVRLPQCVLFIQHDNVHRFAVIFLLIKCILMSVATSASAHRAALSRMTLCPWPCND